MRTRPWILLSSLGIGDSMHVTTLVRWEHIRIDSCTVQQQCSAVTLR